MSGVVFFISVVGAAIGIRWLQESDESAIKDRRVYGVASLACFVFVGIVTLASRHQ